MRGNSRGVARGLRLAWSRESRTDRAQLGDEEEGLGEVRRRAGCWRMCPGRAGDRRSAQGVQRSDEWEGSCPGQGHCMHGHSGQQRQTDRQDGGTTHRERTTEVGDKVNQ